MKPILAFIVALVLLLNVQAPSAAEKLLLPASLVQALVEEVSGEIAFRYAARISQFDRVQGSDGWHEAAEWIKGELERIGYTDAVIEGWPSNGSTLYYTYTTPIGWRARSAELWMVSPRRERLCWFEEMPLTLIKHSGPADIEAELVDVGTGIGEESYRNKDVRGKIVLATGSPGAVAREAVVRRGAVGMVGWYPPDVRAGYPNLVRYTAFWPSWEARDQHGFGFNVSKNQGAVLKQMLEQGQKVVLRASVDAEFYETRIEALSVSLRGSEEPEKELLIIGHLCHPTPSANDNASGAGGMLEMARALKRLVDRGAIPRPRRTIRFLWVPEFYGTVPYIMAHLEQTRNTLAVINCDMIGENLALTGGTFTITRAPDSVPTYLNDVAAHVAAIVERLNLTSINGSSNPFVWRSAPYSGGSDHLVYNDGSLRVPALMFGHGDTFHHTSLDTLEKVDASELRRVSVTALGTMVYLASASDAEARDMAMLVARNGLGRLSADYHDALASLLSAGSESDAAAAYAHVRNVLQHAAWREREAMSSALVYSREPGTRASVDLSAGALENLVAALEADAATRFSQVARSLGFQPLPPRPTQSEQAMAQIVPVRSPDFLCPLDGGYVDRKLGPGALAGVRLRGNQPYEALNFVDGKRSVTDIARAVSAELGPVAVEDVHAYLAVLERAGLLTFHKRPGTNGPR